MPGMEPMIQRLEEKIGAGTFNYLLMTIGGAQLKGKGTACEAVETRAVVIQKE